MSVIAIASFLATQAPITILYQPKVGTSYKSAMTMASAGPMGNTSTSMDVAMKVIGFENGYYKIQSTTSNVKASGAAANNPRATKAMEKTNILYLDKHFKPKMDTKSDSADLQKIMSGMNSAFSGITFPNKPVKVGDTWTNTIDMGALIGGFAKGQKGAEGMKSKGKVNLTYKLMKVDTKSVLIGMSIAGTLTMDAPGNSGTGSQAMKISMNMSGGGTASMERANGVPLNSSTKMTMTMNFGGQPMNMTQSITTKRI